MVVLVGVGRPAERHIMAGIGLGDRANPTCWCYLVAARGDAKGRLTHRVGRTPARWLRERWSQQGLQLIGTRAYIATLTVLYADWLVFPEARLAEEFLQLFPQCRFLNRCQRGQQRYRELEAKLGVRLAWGGFDLSRFPAGQRRAIVERYRDWDQQLAALADQLADLQRAEGQRETWTRWLEQERVLSYPLPAAGAKNP
jgi:hypothetical protein